MHLTSVLLTLVLRYYFSNSYDWQYPFKQNMDERGMIPDSFQQLPTREILLKTHKAELQKRCREMGLTNIWVKKDQLIDMILQNSHVTEKNGDEQQESRLSSNTPTPRPDNQLQLPEPARPPHPEVSQPLDNNNTHLLHVNNTSEDTQLFELGDSQPQDPNATQRPCPDNSHETHTPHPDSLLPPSSPDAVDPHPITASDHSDTTDVINDSQLHTTRHSIDIATQLSLNASNNDQRRKESIEKVTQDISIIMRKLETKDNEIELLNTEIKTAYSLIETLQRRICHLETRARRDEQHEDGTATTSSPLQCLLLGDTNLKRVRRSDLGDNCSVRTVTRANMDLLSSWASEKLTWFPSHCVIYCGLYDIIDGKNPNSIYDSLGSLISNLKDKNSNVEIYVCEIAPVLMSQEIETKIIDYNENLSEWGKQNGVRIVKTAPVLSLGNGEIDDLCFEEENQIQLLNRLGIIKLLSTIDKQCNGFTLSKNWLNTKKNSSTLLNKLEKRDQLLPSRKHQYSDQYNEKVPSQLRVCQLQPEKSSSASYASILRNQASSHRADAETPRWRNREIQSQEPDHLTREVIQDAPMQYRPSHVQEEALMHSPTVPAHREMQSSTETFLHRTSPRGGPKARWERNKRTHHYTASPNFYGDGYEGYWRDSRYNDAPSMLRPYAYTKSNLNPQQGCYNCGEWNHQQRNCRFDHRLRCASCHRLGHKQRMCKYSK